MKKVLQFDNWSCFAACVAMITRTRLEEVYDFLGHDGSGYDPTSNHPEKRRGFHTQEMLKYLVHHGFTLGCFIKMDTPARFDDSEDEPLAPIDFPLRNSMCMLAVESERLPGLLHCVMWDGIRVLDPNPEYTVDRKLSGFKVVEIWPVMYIGQCTFTAVKGEDYGKEATECQPDGSTTTDSTAEEHY